MTGIYRPRKLAERANLILEFPQDKGYVIKSYIPIIENPQISESQRARYTTHSILARPGNLYTYTGSDSRILMVTFKITLPNILGYINEEGLVDKFKAQFRLYNFDRETQIRMFIKEGSTAFNPDRLSSFNKAEFAKKYYYNLIGRNDIFDPNVVDLFSNFIIGDILREPVPDPTASNTRKNEALNLFLLWVNLIRCTTVNNAKNASYGPPIVRLNFGTMYNNVPCVCHDYSINGLPDMGFDVNTLTPRVVEIQLNLHETRTGDFTDYKPKKSIKGDNVAGWESILTDDTMDPYNDDWSSEESSMEYDTFEKKPEEML